MKPSRLGPRESESTMKNYKARYEKKGYVSTANTQVRILHGTYIHCTCACRSFYHIKYKQCSLQYTWAICMSAFTTEFPLICALPKLATPSCQAWKFARGEHCTGSYNCIYIAIGVTYKEYAKLEPHYSTVWHKAINIIIPSCLIFFSFQTLLSLFVVSCPSRLEWPWVHWLSLMSTLETSSMS